MTAGLLFPGQGAQAVGMGKDFAAAFGAARAVFEEADRVLGYADLEALLRGTGRGARRSRPTPSPRSSRRRAAVVAVAAGARAR